jgi:hypothetical protein
VKALCGWAARAAGAHLPTPESVATHDQATVGESFMRVNAARYPRIYLAARAVIVLLSAALGLLVWSFARRLYGPRAGLLALGFYALAPEALAHAGLATMDVATGLGLFASVFAFWGFARAGRWRWWAWTALAVGFAFLVRFTAALLVPILLLLGLFAALRRGAPRARIALGLALLVPSTLLAINLGYLGRTSFLPIGGAHFESHAFRALKDRWPQLRLPLPDDYLLGLDWQAQESDAGNTPTYFMGRVYPGPVWYYFPVAVLFKWPLAFLVALAARLAWLLLRPPPPRRRHEAFVLVPAVAVMLAAMFAVSLNAGVRYVFPMVPFLCVWLGGWMLPLDRPRAAGAAWRKRWVPVAVGLAIVQGGEALAAAPRYLSFFNLAAGGPGRGDRLVNDSNVDWGQGLIALRDAMRRFHIHRIHLAYHGTTDPAVYDRLPRWPDRTGERLDRGEQLLLRRPRAAYDDHERAYRAHDEVRFQRVLEAGAGGAPGRLHVPLPRGTLILRVRRPGWR